MAGTVKGMRLADGRELIDVNADQGVWGWAPGNHLIVHAMDYPEPDDLLPMGIIGGATSVVFMDVFAERKVAQMLTKQTPVESVMILLGHRES